MKVSFYLDKSNLDKAGRAPVYYSLTFKNKRIRKKVKDTHSLLSHWDTRKSRIKPPKKNEDYNYHIEYNKILSDFEARVESIIRHYLLKDIEPTKEDFLSRINSEHDSSLIFDFDNCFQEFIKINKSTKAERTIKGYQTTKNFLNDYCKYTHSVLTFESINIDFFENFRDYAFITREAKNNYFSKLLSTLKTFMTWAFEKEYHESLNYKKFKAKEDETEVIYLTMEELMKLSKHEFDSDRLNHVRDVYCFGCFSGLRFSDIKLLRTSNVFEDYLLLSIKKTKTINHKVPLNIYSKKILSRYIDTIYEPLPVISNQKFNNYIKECCQIIGINTPTMTTRYIGQKRIDKTVPKYQLVTSHTARKTFVTNSLILGMKEMVVRNITGHKKEESFRRYVKIAEDFKKKEMDNTWNKIEPK